MAFRQVFVPGVNEGLFPRPPAEDPLLLRRSGRRSAIELRAEDTELLRIAAACASERLFVSFSRLDLLTGRERVPSFYAFAVHRGGGRAGDRRARVRGAGALGDARRGSAGPRRPTPADAIDDAEFDLATLAPLASGSGQYLKSCRGGRWTRCARAGCAGTSRGRRPTACSSKRSAAMRCSRIC